MIYLRNVHPTRRVLVPLGGGWARMLYPAVTSSVPAGVVALPAVRRMLGAGVLAVVGPTGWDADARQQQADRFGMAERVRAAEQREFDHWRQHQPPRRYRTPASLPNRQRRVAEWPDEWTAVLRERWAEGASPTTIGAELGVTRGAVANKAQREGLPARVRADAWPAERIARLRQRWAAGVSSVELAAELGVSYGAVASQAKRLGLPPRPRSYWAEAARRGGRAAALIRWGQAPSAGRPALVCGTRQDGA